MTGQGELGAGYMWREANVVLSAWGFAAPVPFSTTGGQGRADSWTSSTQPASKGLGQNRERRGGLTRRRQALKPLIARPGRIGWVLTDPLLVISSAKGQSHVRRQPGGGLCSGGFWGRREPPRGEMRKDEPTPWPLPPPSLTHSRRCQCLSNDTPPPDHRRTLPGRQGRPPPPLLCPMQPEVTSP